MKKKLALILAATMTVGLLASCGSSGSTSGSASKPEDSGTSASQTSDLKVGVFYYNFADAYITTVRTPDEITLTNEATGAAVASLNLDPGGQVDLKASASYRKLALTAQDTCFTWSADPEVGTVDANGVFTAGTKSASGNLTVSAGGKTLTVPVSIAGHVKTLEDCEGDLASFGATSTASYGAETGLDYVHNGRQSLRMTYDASTGGTASLNSALPIPAGESWLGVWVYGDGSGNTLMATAADANLQSQQFLLTALDFTGWKYVSAELPEGAATLTSLDVIYGGGAGGPAIPVP